MRRWISVTKYALLLGALGCANTDFKTICYDDRTKCADYDGSIDGSAGDSIVDSSTTDATTTDSGVVDAAPVDAGCDVATPPVGSCVTVTDLSVSLAATSCAILSDLSVRCWGWNSSGQVGDGSGSDVSRPKPIPSLSGALSVAIGEEHACAILGDHSVRCWGKNDKGQLGDGTMSPHSVPTLVTGLTAKTIALGYTDTCALTLDEKVFCWGAGNFAGDGTTTQHSIPTLVPSTGAVVQLAASRDTVCTRSSAGVVSCWGKNSGAVIGTGDSSPRTSPTAVTGTYSSISMGYQTICGIHPGDAKVFCWGDGSFGQFGYTTSGFVGIPTAAPMFDGAKSMQVGGSFICAVGGDNVVRCAGRNDVGELGDGLNLDRQTLAPVKGLGSVDIARSGLGYTCAIVAGGVQCWGVNGSAELGDGTTKDKNVPTAVAW